MQGCEAQRQLKAAVKKEYPGDTTAENFICGIAHAVIDIGLHETTSGLELRWVPFTLVGNMLTKLKRETQLGTKTLSSIVKHLSLQSSFPLNQSDSNRKLLTANLPELLLNADSSVQVLLSHIEWPGGLAHNETPIRSAKSANATADDTLDTKVCPSSQTAGKHATSAQVSIESQRKDIL